MSKNPKFKWVDNTADHSWYLIDTRCGNMVLFEIQHCVQNIWTCVSEDKHIMANQIIENWTVCEYVKHKGKLEEQKYSFYQEYNEYPAKSFIHARTIVNRKMVAKHGKRWKEK